MKLAALVALVLATCATPATARSIGERIADLPVEQKIAFGVAAVDAGWTSACLHERRPCREVGPMSAIFGHHPSTGEVIGTRMGTALLSALGVSLLQDRNPDAARWVARLSLGVSAVGIGFHIKRTF